MLSIKASGGFTLIELLVTMSLAAILLSLGAPALSTYLQNSKLGASTSVLYSAIQNARAEAIRTNARAQFVFTDTPVSTANLGNALAPAVAGRNWVVRVDQGGGNMLAVDSKDGGEGESNTTVPAVQFAGAAIPPTPAFDGTITFDGLGATVPAGASYTIAITNPAAGVCVSALGPIRCRQITVRAGGQISACDPAAPPGDSRACN
ncbi:MAG: GspH/FimT family pseudopilin [Caldimonas sp.]